jgi:O-antigen/teichoic acid export membrane protein
MLLMSHNRPSVLVLALLVGAPVVPLIALARTESAALQGIGYVVRGQIPANLLRPAFVTMALFFFYFAGVKVGPIAAMAINSIAAGIIYLIAFIWLHRRLAPHLPVAPVRAGRKWLASSIPMAMTDGIRILQTEMTVVLLGVVASPVAVGYFRIASATALTSASAILIVAQVAVPTLARLYEEKDHARLQNVVTAFAWAQLAGVLVIALPLLLFPQFLISAVFGASYVPAVEPLEILLVGHVASAAFGPNAILLNMAHHERRLTRAVAIATAIGLTLAAILSRFNGASGAATGILAWMLVWNVLTWRDARKLLDIETSIIRMPRRNASRK